MVYEYADGNYIPTGEIKPLKSFLVGEYFLAPEFGEMGMQYIPYQVKNIIKTENSMIILSERAMV
jgi:hypothetical protein